MNHSYQSYFEQRVSELSMVMSADVCQKMLAYHALLIKWNHAYNLTAIREPQAMIDRHLVDSLSVLPYLRAGSLLDVGTGAGLPGLILGLMDPNRSVYLLDSNGKKIRFLQHVKRTLSLDNIVIVQERVEQWQPDQQFAQITSRAFASLSDMVKGCRHLLARDGCFLAMKGVFPEQEMSDLPEGIVVEQVNSLQVPGNQGQRHLIQLGFSAE